MTRPVSGGDAAACQATDDAADLLDVIRTAEELGSVQRAGERVVAGVTREEQQRKRVTEEPGAEHCLLRRVTAYQVGVEDENRDGVRAEHRQRCDGGATDGDLVPIGVEVRADQTLHRRTAMGDQNQGRRFSGHRPSAAHESPPLSLS